MARQEQDREDLMREATALVERVELRLPQRAEPVVLGVRRDGCLSVYLSADQAVHFNTRCELRRAFMHGQLWKAEHHRLVALIRNRTEREVQLVRHELTQNEQSAALLQLQSELADLTQLIADDQFQVKRAVPADLPVKVRVSGWLAPVRALRVADAPHAR